MLVTLNEILNVPEGQAVGAFDVTGLPELRAIIDAAEEAQVPVILSLAELHFGIAPLELIAPSMMEAARAASVPVCVHLDHGVNLETVQKALDLGFTSVMYDGSALPYEQNIANTRASVEMAKKTGASVEAELGRMQSDEGHTGKIDQDLKPEDYYTVPSEAQDFVDKTGVDALAISFGTAHGVYKAEPKLDFDRIAQIKEATGIPLVMHGGSGVSDDDYRKVIHAGINKINYYTYMSMAGAQAVKELIDEKGIDGMRFDQMEEAARQAMQKDVAHAMAVFSGSSH
ncbi:MAG: class II fructose-bisphosphate aldolase [Eubacteriaceae bacterium]|jgi:fructose-bisphosphate aldolase class II